MRVVALNGMTNRPFAVWIAACKADAHFIAKRQINHGLDLEAIVVVETCS